MKKISMWIPLFALLLLSSSFGAGVTDVTLTHLKGGVAATVTVDGPVRFQHEIVEPKDGRPYRVLVDILAATHELGKQNFVNLPEGPIERLRTSQYAVSPEKVVRLVFDMKSAPVYNVTAEDGAVKVLFTDATVKPFANWSSSDYVASIRESVRSPEPASPPTPDMPQVAPSRADQMNDSIQQDKLASLSAEKSDKPAPADEKPTPEAKPADQPAPKKETPKVPSTVAKAEKKGTYAAKPAAANDNKPEPKQDTFVGPPAPAKVAQAAPSDAKPSPKKDTPAPPKAEQKSPADAKPSQKPAVAKKPAPTNAEEPAVAKKPADDTKGDETTVADADADSKTRSTSRFRRNPASQAKLKGTMVAEFPKRLVVKYSSGGTRDPFETLINDSKTNDNPIEGRVPNVDGLRLVGIIQAHGGGNQALFEDKDGYSYILKSGDKVRKGYVLRVEVDRVYFQIFEYGWSRTVALQIDN